MRIITLICFGFLICWNAASQTPFTVLNITDRAIYPGSRTFSVPVEAGYTYAGYLNGTNRFSGGSYTIRDADFYLVQAFRTNNATGDVTNQYFRIIIEDPARQAAGGGDNTERGLPSHTPLIAIPSSSNEFAGGRLRLIAPAAMPRGYEIPVVAWAVNAQDKALRANGWLEASGHPSIFLRRGVGSGFLGSNNPAGILNYSANLKGIQVNKSIAIESAPSWITVSGTLSGNVLWAEESRIHVTAGVTLTAGSTLTIGAGSIVRLNPGVSITNNGTITINGTLNEPVVFMPNSRLQYWGGFQMRSGQGVVNATGTIFAGSGAAANWFSGGHKREQALFDTGQSLTLTDCAQIYSAGQFGRNGGIMTLTRFLVQRVTSAGEFSGASFRVNDSAFIEVPDDSSNFVDGDNDALYLDDGNHGFTNTLFGWTKDDGIDSGGNGPGTIHYEGCWFESTFHEGNSLSGVRDALPRNCVYIDCGQGLESGYDDRPNGGPNGWVNQCLFLACKSGLRHGDNYSGMPGYSGLMTASNSILLFNHRDVFGYNWDSEGGWTNASGQMNIRNNWLTKPDTNFPDNVVWNPATDGWRLGAFSTAPGDADVGVGMALRSPQVTITQLTNGIPVRLSTFSTNFVSVDYVIESEAATLATGTLQFVPGEIVKYVRITPAQAQNQSLLRVRLQNPVRAEITANPVAFYSSGATTPQSVVIIPANSLWKYPNVAGAQPASWTGLDFDDSAWQEGPAELGFGDLDEARTITRFVGQMTYYFRKRVTVSDPSAFIDLRLWIRRDDGAVMYFNSQEAFRSSSMPALPAVITFTTAAVNQGDNFEETRTLSTSGLIAGDNMVAVEVHQDDGNSSDISFNAELVGTLAPRLELRNFRGDWLLFWADPAFKLQQASTLAGPWTTLSAPSPVQVDTSAPSRFYRLVR